MDIRFSPQAEKDLDEMDQQLRKLFFKHADKIREMPPRRHMKLGLPFHAENVTKQARLVYDVDEKDILIVRCFASHKEYEKWYKSYK